MKGPLDMPDVGFRGDLLCRLAMELALGEKGRHNERELPDVAATSLVYLTAAIVQVAAFNSNPRAIIEHVKQLLDTADVERAAANLRKGN